MPSDEPEQPTTPAVELVPRRPTETDSEAVAGERTRLDDVRAMRHTIGN